MKKLTAIVLLVALMLSLVSCGDTEPSTLTSGGASTESAEPGASTAPSDIPSIEPSIEPSAEPSEPPADDIDAYWEGRTLTSDSGDLMMDAARWVRDYYRSFWVDQPDNRRIESIPTAARIVDINNSEMDVLFEILTFGTNDVLFEGEYMYTNGYRNWRRAVFRFERSGEGYVYAGLSEPSGSTLEVNASIHGEAMDMGRANDVWRFESIIAELADGEAVDEIPSEAEHVGAFNYQYADVDRNWNFYRVPGWHTFAKCTETGELIDCEWVYSVIDKLPSPQELCDIARETISNSLFLRTYWGNFYLSEDVRADILEHIDFVDSSDSIRPYEFYRDVREDRRSFSFYDSEHNFSFNAYYGSELLYVSVDGLQLMVSDADDIRDTLDRAAKKLVDTVRDGQFLTNYERWDVPEVEVEEYELLRRASDLLDPFDGSNWLGEGPAPEKEDVATIEYNGMVYFDHTPFCDPDADNWTAHISSYAEFEAYVRELFCEELADRCLREGWHYSTEENPPFIKGPNGELYGRFSGRGGGNPAVGEIVALYRFEPRQNMLVLREIRSHYEPDSGDWHNYNEPILVGEAAWDTVFVREQGQWKLLDTSRVV